MYDVVIVGGGPAGLSAALVLGRCRRRVLVCDAGEPRNAASLAMHGYLTRDGVSPAEFLRLGRDELAAYGITPRQARVVDVRRAVDGFDVRLENEDVVRGRTVLLATGVRDEVPDVPGLAECYGRSVHHCPYCDGWEHRDKTIAVIGDRRSPAGLALALKTWSDRIVACTLGGVRVSAAQQRKLMANDIPLYTTPLARVAHTDGQVTGLVFDDGHRVACDAIFFTGRQAQQSTLAERLGCEFTGRGTVKTDHLGRTCVEGIYVVGDASRDVQFVVVATAEGAKAGVAINKILQARAGLVPEVAS